MVRDIGWVAFSPHKYYGRDFLCKFAICGLNNHHMKTKFKFFVLFLSTLFCVKGWCYDIESDGIYFDILSFDERKLSVVSGPEVYSGTIILPDTVVYSGMSFTVTTIGQEAFNRSTIDSIIISKTITTIPEGAFRNCKQLNSIVIPSNVMEIGDGAFLWCSSLHSIIIEDSPEPLALKWYSGMTIVDNRNLYGDPLYVYVGRQLTISYSGWSGWISPFRIYDTNVSFELTENTTFIDEQMFADMRNLKSLDIPNTVVEIRRAAFYNCKSLESIAIPDAVAKIGNNVFSQCEKLKRIKLSNSLTSIPNEAFYECSSLDSLIIPKMVTSIGYQAFDKCPQLKTLIMKPETPPTIDPSTFSAISYLSTTVVVPKGCLDAYTQTANWSNFQNIVESGAEDLAQFNISLSVGSGGSAEYHGIIVQNTVSSFKLTEGDSAVISISPADGFTVDKFTVNYIDETDKLKNDQYFIDDVYKDYVIEVSFKRLPIYLTFKTSTGASIKQEVEYGYIGMLEISGDDNGGVRKVLFNGNDVTELLKDGCFETPAITSSSTIEIFYDAQPIVMSVAQPVISSEDGIVSITCEQEDVVILYSTDGSNPLLSGLQYSGPFEMAESGTVSAIAVIQSETATYYATASGVDFVNDRAVSTKYFDDSGKECSSTSSKISIVVTQYESGRIMTTKKITR